MEAQRNRIIGRIMQIKVSEKEQAIGGFRGLSESVRTAAGYLADCIEKDHGTRNGNTALFWHIIAICQEHRGDQPRPWTLPTDVEFS